MDENGHADEHIAIEDMTAEGPALLGTEEQLSFDLGSQYNLAMSSVKLGSIPLIAVDGQYQEGDRLRVTLEVEVGYISFPPIKDRGFRVGTERRHHADIISVSPVN